MSKISLNKKYAPIILNDTRYFSVIGGRSSGKSFAVSTILSLMMLENNTRILFLRKTLSSAHLSVIPEFVNKLEILGISELFNITKTEITHKTNGSAIFFRGVQSSSGDNTANLKSLAGISCVCFDEFEEITDESTFDRIDLSVRVMDKVNKIICVMNPTTREHFFYKRFFEDMGVNDDFNGSKDNVTYIFTSYLDNLENINPSFIEQAELMKKTNIKKYNHIMLGAWLPKAEGVIFENWEVGDFKDTDNMLWGSDFGFRIDPTTLIHVSIDKAQKIMYLKEECYKPGMTTDDIAELMKEKCKRDLIVADSAEPRLIEELSRGGLNIIPCVKGAGSVREGIALLLNYKLIISPDSVNLIKEANNYAWNDKKSETPIDKWNHAWDAIRYAATHALTTKPREISFGW